MHYKLRQLEREDLEIVKNWRNENVLCLRQFKLINELDQDNFYNENKDIYVVVTEVNELFDFDRLCGMLGLTYIDWKNRSAEVSIITEDYSNIEKFSSSIYQFIRYAFLELGFNRLYNEVYKFDSAKKELWKSLNWTKEAILKESVFHNGKFCDSHIYRQTFKEFTEQV
jgi:RimJ/RimL family protein N-acetyltransferase